MLPSPRTVNAAANVAHQHQHSRPRLPSFDELTGSLWGYSRADSTAARETGSRPPILQSPFASPCGSDYSPKFPATFPPVVHHRPSEESQQPTPPPVALFPPPPPVRYDPHPVAATSPVVTRTPSHDDDRPTEADGWELDDDLTKIPLGWSYKEALDAITQSAFALHEFGRRFAEECRQLETGTTPSGDGSSETVTYARLPSRLMVSQMMGNVGIVQKKLKEVQGVVRRAEEGGYECRYPSPNPSPGRLNGEGDEGVDGGGKGGRVVVGGKGGGRGRMRRKKKDSGGGGVTKKPASLHNRFRQLHVHDGKITISGRCLACDRTESTEWRRGPEGMRTLCNACGLRYAKSCAGREESVIDAAGNE